MKLCMMSYTMARQPQYFSVRGMFDLSRELGLEGIDFVTLHDTDPRELRQMSADAGLTVACHTFFADLDFPTAAERQAGVDAAKQGIEHAVALGAPVVMIPTPNRRDIPRDDCRRNFIAGLAEVIDFARQAGVALTVENFPGVNSPFVTAADVLQAVEEVPGVKITYDNGNAFSGEEPAASFARCAAHVVHAHFKDWQRMPEGEGRLMLNGGYYVPALIGEGAVDQRACLKAMMEAGYRGFINIEYEGNTYPPDVAVRNATAYLRRVMEEIAAEG